MRHLLMDPKFPDVVGEWAKEISGDEPAAPGDYREADEGEPVDSLLWIARTEIARTRLW